MNKKRMLQLVKDLESVSPTEFDMCTWKRANCTTVGCAVGTHIIKHKNCGLKFCDPTEGEDDEGRPILEFDIKYGKIESSDAAAAYFDISEYDADHLFMPGNYEEPEVKKTWEPTKREVINRIKKFIKEKPNSCFMGIDIEDAKNDLQSAEEEAQEYLDRIDEAKENLAKVKKRRERCITGKAKAGDF